MKIIRGWGYEPIEVMNVERFEVGGLWFVPEVFERMGAQPEQLISINRLDGMLCWKIVRIMDAEETATLWKDV